MNSVHKFLAGIFFLCSCAVSLWTGLTLSVSTFIIGAPLAAWLLFLSVEHIKEIGNE